MTGRSVGDQALFSCNTGYELSGSTSVTCNKGGVWSGNIPTCNSKSRFIYICLLTELLSLNLTLDKI